jgi:hypothetical protein
MIVRVRSVAILVALTLAAVPAAAQTRPIDTGQSTLTIYVYKSGLFSAFADDHVVDAPVASGSLSEAAPLAVSLEVEASALKVRDPKLSASKRAEVQARMAGPEVLDTMRFPTIGFASSAIAAAGTDRWTVSGRLTIHGQSRDIMFPVVRANGRYKGTVTVKQSDYGIMPISIAGGSVKVKDEIKIEFDVVGK